MRRALVFVVALSCHRRATSADAGQPTDEVRADQLVVSFADLPLHVDARACDRAVVELVSGKSDNLAPGDVVFLQNMSADVGGTGTVVYAHESAPCSIPVAPVRLVKHAAAELTWADGKMHAHLDGEGLAPYIGRLSGTAPVAEHFHEGSWEIRAIEAAGTFRVEGVPRRVMSHMCIAVEPKKKHSWTPDPGTTLTAIQLYNPPGPEQRFKALAKP